jgi:hypothetical protein
MKMKKSTDEAFGLSQFCPFGDLHVCSLVSRRSINASGCFHSSHSRVPVELVEMGHMHYNELANDGHTIYAVTRSTGQIEEGSPGFSFTAINGDVVSWKFTEHGPWPSWRPK